MKARPILFNAEMVRGLLDGRKTQCLGSARFAFANLWISTGGDWHSNPWVWVVEFEVIHKNIDAVMA